MKKNKIIEDLNITIPLHVAIKTIVELGSFSAVLNSDILEDGCWTEKNEKQRNKFLKEIEIQVTKHLLEELEKYGADINKEI